MSDKYRIGSPQKHRYHNTGDKAVEGIMDVTRIAATGIVAVGVLGAVGSAFKK
jgi:hypothetical protein